MKPSLGTLLLLGGALALFTSSAGKQSPPTALPENLGPRPAVPKRGDPGWRPGLAPGAFPHGIQGWIPHRNVKVFPNRIVSFDGSTSSAMSPDGENWLARFGIEDVPALFMVFAGFTTDNHVVLSVYGWSRNEQGVYLDVYLDSFEKNAKIHSFQRIPESRIEGIIRMVANVMTSPEIPLIEVSDGKPPRLAAIDLPMTAMEAMESMYSGLMSEAADDPTMTVRRNF